jgi:adenylate cyclase
MQRVMIDFNSRLRADGLPTLNMRVGILTGDMVVGDAGPTDGRDYTVLGDNVNLASRLEGANKATGTNTMIHWRTRELLGEQFVCRPIGRLQVKGKTEGVMTFEPLGPAGLITLQQRRIVELSTAVVDAYITGKFADCITAIDLMEAEVGPSKFTHLYRKEAQHRIEEFAFKDISEFTGVITLSEK